MKNIREILKNRVLLLDGAMGSLIQRESLSEEDFRGERFINHPVNLKGNNDILCLTRPDVISNIHKRYLSAGSDIIETDTFNATSISQADYQTQSAVYDINFAAAKIAKQAADEFSTDEKPRFVAGSMGPLNKTASMSPDVNNPGFRAVSFNDLTVAYGEQASALLDGGVDIFLVETVFDTLNAKAALFAINSELEKRGISKFPVMVSATVADKSGRTLSGQTMQAFLYSVQHIDLLSVGLNCSFGAREMKPYLIKMGEESPFCISAYPNAGLPNQFGEYDETPQIMAQRVEEFLSQGVVNIIGGCCGTTPEHIKAMADVINRAVVHKPAQNAHKLTLSGLDPLIISKESSPFFKVGERANVAGSRKFLRLITEKKYDEALDIVRGEVESGADVIDINMDDAMLDAKTEMVTFLNLLAAEPDAARLPVMIDSSDFNVIEAGLQCVQGKPIVNSISLKEGEQIFLDHARTVKKYGAAVVVMAFDEQGQADTFQRRIEICNRAYNLLTREVDFEPADIIFDPNVLAIATGIEQHNNYAKDFILTCAWIKENLPFAKISGGVSNLSFSFRGNTPVREAMHSVFLHFAVQQGMDMGIVNPASMIDFDDIEPLLKQHCIDVILNKDPLAGERLVEYAETVKNNAKGVKAESHSAWRDGDLESRLLYSLQKGISEYLKTDLDEALVKYPHAVDIIQIPLMNAMNVVGELFGKGEMFLPQVVKTARVMKIAVEILQPVITSQQSESIDNKRSRAKVLIATVKGDVHDIGKNIVSVIMTCNNFDVIDLGVMVPAEVIVETAIKEKVDCIGLSGLITPSLNEMINVVKLLKQKGLTIPVLIGGATTSEIHTAVKIAPEYDGVVAYVADASKNVFVANSLINNNKDFIQKLLSRQKELRDSQNKKSFEDNLHKSVTASKLSFLKYQPVEPQMYNIVEYNDFDLTKLIPLINWRMFLYMWKITGKFEGLDTIADEASAQQFVSLNNNTEKARQVASLILDARNILNELTENKIVKANAAVRILPVLTHDDRVTVYENRSDENILEHIDFKRVDTIADKSLNRCLADFLNPEGDYLGFFAATTGMGSQEYISDLRKQNLDYKADNVQFVLNSAVEAFSKFLHREVSRYIWGFAPANEFSGIRPAPGYPIDPDHSHKKQIFNLLDAEKTTGITLTDSLMMNPLSSVCGFYFGNPESYYFC